MSPYALRRRLAPLAAALLVVAALGSAPTTTAGAAAAATAQSTTTQRADSPGYFTNPVFQPDLPDPSVIQDRATGLWYAFGTTDYWTSSSSSLHIMPILSSPNLVNWTFVRNTFSPPGASPMPGSPTEPAWAGNVFLWAPEVHYIDGSYVMYYTASGTRAGGSAIGLATASSPAGPWHDAGGPLVGPIASPTGGYESVIDPDEIRTPAGQRYLYYGSFAGGIHVLPLSANGSAIEGTGSGTQVAAAGTFEGTSVVHHHGYYYLFASSGSCCTGANTGYEEVVGRSRSPLGPFVDRAGVPMLAGGRTVVAAANGNNFVGPGGGTAFRDDAGRWWMVLHVVQHSDPYLSSGATRRALALEPIEWGRGGWPAINDGRGVTSGPQPSPATLDREAPRQVGSDPLNRVPRPGRLLPAYSQDFDTNALGPQWSWVRGNPANWSLDSKPGTLSIDAVNGDLYQTTNTAQNILVERAPAGNFVAETKVAFRPTQNYEQAGLLLYQDDDHYMRLVGEYNTGIDTTEWAKETDVTTPYAGFDCGPAYPADTCPVYGSGFLEVPGFSPAARAVGGSGTWAWLRIVRRGNLITAYTSMDGRRWTSGATYNLHGFVSGKPLEIGLMAITAGPNVTLPAHFGYVHVYALPGVRCR